MRSPSFPAYVPPASPTTAASQAPAAAERAAGAATPAGALQARSGSAAPAAAAADEPLLPRVYDENELRAAVGASPVSEPAADKGRKAKKERRRDGDDSHDAPRPPRNRRAVATVATSITAVVAIAVTAFLGSMNSDRYLLACEAERAVPQQGRGFPPWGARALDGEAWKPLKITAETRCKPHETDDVRELERLYLAMIMEQTTALLSAREVTKIDDAEALLKQGLLLTRPPAHESEKLATERNERHNDIERLLGDVTYWRATAKLRDAASALTDAAKQFDSAAAQHPRHVSDAPAWATYARKLAQELHAGPAGATPTAAAAPPAAAPTAPTPERAAAPAGVALPVEPATGSATAPAPAAPPDAGVSPGGVLL
jgi:hypothetical protein